MGLNRESLEISHNLDLGPYVHKEPHLAQSGGSLHLIVPILPYGYTILGPTYKLMLNHSYRNCCQFHRLGTEYMVGIKPFRG